MANRITCPECGHAIDVSQADYAAVLAQVRGQEFEREVAEAVRVRCEALEARHQADKAAAVAAVRSELEGQLAMARTDTVRLNGELSAARVQAASDLKLREMELRQELEGRFASEKAEAAAEAARTRAELEAQVAYYKDMKARMSTKMVGESLEEHCRVSFDRIRAAAFPDAYFEKDNEVSASGSKGDFVFRESRDGVELLSIMFEMKNEADEGASRKHRNEEFFRELDKDRREKGCEYAVLVSLLEPDSDLYNDGIVDVSHRYPKMYVIRPQFFVPMITILRNAALNGLAVRKELAEARAMNADLAAFEDRLGEAKAAVGRNYELAGKQYQDALDGIDKAIAQLQKTKESLMKSERNLRLMNDKVDALSVRKLAAGSPSLLAGLD